ncbi:MAG: tryptophan synthase subunit alpha [Propionibacteriaceae bacterium]|jgi:tryptophan synthase alpha chain|nr:tryptophan synthase subunit alpha [Propionibacteriaceae bacterium]
MSDIARAFDHGPAFIAFLTGGDPTIEQSRQYALALIEGGADLLEIGIPFSDPIAEGPVIQAANVRSLTAGATIEKIFGLAASIHAETTAPIVFLTYLNPVFHYGYDAFMKRCAEAGVSGLIIPDLPYEEQGEIIPAARAHGIDVITLVAPTSADRIARIADDATGFVYLVSSLGVTGARSEITTDLGAIREAIRARTDTPVAVGFGVHTPDQAGAIATQADGAIVGSKIVSIIAEHPDDAAGYLRDYAASMKQAMVSALAETSPADAAGEQR